MFEIILLLFLTISAHPMPKFAGSSKSSISPMEQVFGLLEHAARGSTENVQDLFHQDEDKDDNDILIRNFLFLKNPATQVV